MNRIAPHCTPALLCALSTALLSGSFRARAELPVVSTRSVEIPEAGPATFTVLTTSKMEFSLLPPKGWRATADPATGTVTWKSPDYSSMIRLGIQDHDQATGPATNGAAVSNAAASNAAALRRAALREIPGASVKAEFPCFASLGPGVALDCEHVVNDQFPVSARFAIVPYPGGAVQLNLTTPRKDFARGQAEFNQLLNSLRADKVKARP